MVMNEQISALLDDEISIDEAGHIIVAVESQKAASLAWQQYLLIGDAMRGDAILSADFKQNLMQKLDAEPTVLAPNMRNIASTNAQEASFQVQKSELSSQWAIAASFAAVMVVSYMALQNVNSTQDTALRMASNDNNVQVAQIAAQSPNSLPIEYLTAHQVASPSASNYYIQTTSYSE
jgi:sigma-E factor negative regulatory protein RseA